MFIMKKKELIVAKRNKTLAPLDKQIDKCFVAKLINRQLEEIRYVDNFTFMFYTVAKQVEFAGFTEESYRWLFLFCTNSLSELKKMNLSLSNLWRQSI